MKLAVFSTVLTILLLCGGGAHYLSTTKNLSEPGSLAILGLVKYPILTTLTSLEVYTAIKLCVFSK